MRKGGRSYPKGLLVGGLLASIGVPYHLTILVEASNLLGHLDEGLRLLDEAQTILEQHEDRWFEAEIYRLRGELLLWRSNTQEAEVEPWLRRALDVARSQQAKSLELRAATSLARLGTPKASIPKHVICCLQSMAGLLRDLTLST